MVGVDCVPAGSLVLVGVHSTRGEAVGIVRTESARREGAVLTLDWVGGEDIDDKGLGWVGFVVVSLLAVTGELATAVGVDWAGGEDTDDMGLGWVGFVVVSLLAVTGELATAVGVHWIWGDSVALVKLDWAGEEDIDDTELEWVGFVVVSLPGVTGEVATAVWAEGEVD